MIPLLTPPLPQAAAPASAAPHPSVPPSLHPSVLSTDYFLPDGTPLLLTLFKKAKLAALLAPEGQTFAGPADEMQDLILLFFAAFPRHVWSAPGPAPDGTMRPLYARPDDFDAELEQWSAGPACAGLSLAQMSRLASDLWTDAHRNFVIPVEKKTEPLTPRAPLQGGFISTSTSSAEAMPAAPDTSSTSCPSPMPTDSSTHGSTPTASNASPLPNPPAEPPLPA